MNIVKTLSTLLFLSLTLISCSNDDSNYTPKENRLVKETSDKTTKTFSYDESNQLSKIIEIGEIDSFGTTQSVTNFTYDSSGKIASKIIDYTGTNSFSFQYIYQYVGDQLSFCVVQRKIGNGSYFFLLKNVYNYSEPNKIIQMETRYDSEYNEVITKSILNFANENLVDVTVYTNVTDANPNGQLNNTNLYSNYDTKKSPYDGLPLKLDFPYSSQNNVGKFDSLNASITYTYKYNADGYPIKKTASNNAVITYTYEQI